MAAALGLGIDPGTPVLSLGTSGTAFAVSERRPVDPSGIVAGFADASGRYLPLACTLNATLAVDRMAAWLGLERDDVEPGGEVVVLPWLDGERTPNLPHAAGSIHGLRHATTRGQILRATYDGAIAGLLDAIAAIGACSSGVADDAAAAAGGRRRAGRGLARRRAAPVRPARAGAGGDGARGPRRGGPGRQPADGRGSGRASRAPGAPRRASGSTRGRATTRRWPASPRHATPRSPPPAEDGGL